MDKYDIFIGYQGENTHIARSLYNRLSNGYKVFFDKESLIASDEWVKKIPEAQRNSLVSLILVSDISNKSVYPENEIISAVKLYKDSNHIIIPIVIDGDLPFPLLSFQAIYYKDKSMRSIYIEIKKVLMSKKIFEKDVDEGKHIVTDDLNNHSLNIVSGNIDNSVRYEDVKNNLRKDYYLLDTLSEIVKKHYILKKDNGFMIYIDIDKFSNINKKYSDKVGDVLMFDIHNLFKRLCNNFYLEKIGKDEFIIFVDKPQDDLLTLLEEIRKAISEFRWERISETIFVTVSIGWSKIVFPKNSTNFINVANDWLIRAILGCNHAKKRGGNGIQEGPSFIEKFYRGDYKDYLS